MSNDIGPYSPPSDIYSKMTNNNKKTTLVHLWSQRIILFTSNMFKTCFMTYLQLLSSDSPINHNFSHQNSKINVQMLMKGEGKFFQNLDKLYNFGYVNLQCSYFSIQSHNFQSTKRFHV